MTWNATGECDYNKDDPEHSLYKNHLSTERELLQESAVSGAEREGWKEGGGDALVFTAAAAVWGLHAPIRSLSLPPSFPTDSLAVGQRGGLDGGMAGEGE